MSAKRSESILAASVPVTVAAFPLASAFGSVEAADCCAVDADPAFLQIEVPVPSGKAEPFGKRLQIRNNVLRLKRDFEPPGIHSVFHVRPSPEP